MTAPNTPPADAVKRLADINARLAALPNEIKQAQGERDRQERLEKQFRADAALDGKASSPAVRKLATSRAACDQHLSDLKRALEALQAERVRVLEAVRMLEAERTIIARERIPAVVEGERGPVLDTLKAALLDLVALESLRIGVPPHMTDPEMALRSSGVLATVREQRFAHTQAYRVRHGIDQEAVA